MSTPAALADYTDHLASRLVGPPARRSAILDEVLDGLLCAAEEHARSCPDPERAAHLAVEEWGPPDEIAAAYNDATMRLSAGRFSLRALGVLPLLGLSYAVALLGGPEGPWPRHPPILLAGIALIGLGCALCLTGALAALRGGAGLPAAGGRPAPAVTSGTYAALAGVLCVLVALIVLLVNRGVTHPGSLDWGAVAAPAALTVLAVAYFSLALRRFLLVARLCRP